jgi:hypothetical protein
MAPSSRRISYSFHLPDGQKDRIDLEFDADSFALLPPRRPARDWTALGVNQCANCPLSPATSPRCPFALALDGFIHRFDNYFSYEKVVVEVTTDRRTVISHHPLQEGMASILGLIGATSGCPVLEFLRPMARFHLPFATEEETLVRVFAFHLLGDYVRAGGRGAATMDLKGLEARYQAVAQVNAAMADRIRSAFTKDAVVNAIIILDTFAQAVPWVADKALDELRPLFPTVIPAPVPAR